MLTIVKVICYVIVLQRRKSNKELVGLIIIMQEGGSQYFFTAHSLQFSKLTSAPRHNSPRLSKIFSTPDERPKPSDQVYSGRTK